MGVTLKAPAPEMTSITTHDGTEYPVVNGLVTVQETHAESLKILGFTVVESQEPADADPSDEDESLFDEESAPKTAPRGTRR
jgi:hypothetical protein